MDPRIGGIRLCRWGTERKLEIIVYLAASD